MRDDPPCTSRNHECAMLLINSTLICLPSLTSIFLMTCKKNFVVDFTIVNGLGFKVQGSGCRVRGSGFRVQGSGCRVQGAGCRVQGSGFRVDDRAAVVRDDPPCTSRHHEIYGIFVNHKIYGGFERNHEICVGFDPPYQGLLGTLCRVSGLPSTSFRVQGLRVIDPGLRVHLHPPPLGPPYVPRHRATAGSYGGGGSYGRGTPKKTHPSRTLP